MNSLNILDRIENYMKIAGLSKKELYRRGQLYIVGREGQRGKKPFNSLPNL